MQGILFNEPTGMLSSTIEGTKTKTRRLGGLDKVNSQPDMWYPQQCLMSEETGGLEKVNFISKNGKYAAECKPRYKVGETVFIKESHCRLFGKEEILYRVDGHKFEKLKPWSNPMFCGEYDKITGIKIARYYIKILDIKVERLQEIMHEDCIKEGIQPYEESGDYPNYEYCMSKDNQQDDWGFLTSIQSFKSLINYINGKGTWERNPWVFSYEYELMEKLHPAITHLNADKNIDNKTIKLINAVVEKAIQLKPNEKKS